MSERSDTKEKQMATTLKERRETGQDSRSLILAVALDLFTRRGFDGTSIDDIRQAAGFKSKASLYTHFTSKEEVASALFEKYQAELSEAVLEATRTASPDPLSRFVTMGRAFIEWGLTHPQQYAFRYLRVQQEKLMSGAYGYLGENPDPVYLEMIALLRQIRAEYPVRQIADAALLSMIVGLISKAVIDQESFGETTLQTRVLQILEMCFGVLFASPVALPS